MVDSVDMVYIIHYAPLQERRVFLERSLLENGITRYEFVTDYDRNTTTQETMEQYYKGSTLVSAQICISISHLEIYKKVLANKYDMVLILEDDAILAPDFKARFDAYYSVLPRDFEIGFLNNGCNLHVQGVRPDQIWYPAKSSRTCCSYMITRECCEKLVKSSIPFNEVIDFELNTQISNQGLKCYWCEPTIVSDGSTSRYAQSYLRYNQLH